MPKRGRPQTIFIDDMDLLRGIHRAWKSDVAQLRSEVAECRRLAKKSPYIHERFRASQSAGHLGRLVEDIAAHREAIQYDLPRFLGRELTPSEKVRARQSMQRLHDDDLIVLAGQRATGCTLTTKGLARLKEIRTDGN